MFQNGVGSLLVSWGSAQGDSNVVTGYTIFYQGSDGGKGSSINAESTYATIAQLVVGATYSVTVIANSALLTSVESKERHKTISMLFTEYDNVFVFCIISIQNHLPSTLLPLHHHPLWLGNVRF